MSLISNVVDTLVQNVGESDAAFLIRLNLYVQTQQQYYEQAGGTYPCPVERQGDNDWKGFPPSQPIITVFWDAVNTQMRQIATFAYDNAYYVYLMGGPGVLPPTLNYPVIYQGQWDANANSPLLSSGVGVQGHYYEVSVSGTTSLDSINSWGVRDWVVFNGTAWTRVVNAQATETLRGVAEIATTSETIAEVNDTKIVTPYKLGRWLIDLLTRNIFFSGIVNFVSNKLRIRHATNVEYVEIQCAPTANRTVTIQDGDGTLAFLSDISGSGGLTYAVASGTNTYTATIPGVVAYTAGDAYSINFTNGSDADSTININGLGAKTLVKEFDVQVTGGDIVSGQELIIIYDGTNFQCLGVAPNQMFAYVTNDDSVTITKGQPVYAFGSAGNRMSVKLASNTSDATSAQTVGLVYSSSIAANQRGFIIVSGVISGVNTGAYSPGDQLYLGATAGTLTSTKPYAPNHIVYVGIVERANAGNGQIYVKCQNGYEMDEIHDVDLITTPPVTGDVLSYNGVTQLWSGQSIASVLGYTPVTNARTLTINGTAQDLTLDRTWNVGTVTSVGLALPTEFAISGSPVTGAETTFRTAVCAN